MLGATPFAMQDAQQELKESSTSNEHEDSLVHPDPHDVRELRIYKKNLETHGYTPRCYGCTAVKMAAKYHKQHNPACRERLRKILTEHESTRHRIVHAEARKQQLAEGTHEEKSSKRQKIADGNGGIVEMALGVIVDMARDGLEAAAQSSP